MKSKLWTVKLYLADGSLYGSCTVYAPNRRFARWNGLEALTGQHIALGTFSRITATAER
jgi:hypothetical protein